MHRDRFVGLSAVLFVLRPFAKRRCLISANIAGSFCSIHSYRAAELAVNRKSSHSFIRSSTERNVAFTSWKPSGHCHSQTGSRWAFPIMCKVLSGIST